jgi:integrase
VDDRNELEPRTGKARGPLFVGRDGKRARVIIRRPWIQACKAADLVEVLEVDGKRGKPLKRNKPTVRTHDLRHSFVSHLVLSGVSLKAAAARDIQH